MLGKDLGLYLAILDISPVCKYYFDIYMENTGQGIVPAQTVGTACALRRFQKSAAASR